MGRTALLAADSGDTRPRRPCEGLEQTAERCSSRTAGVGIDDVTRTAASQNAISAGSPSRVPAPDPARTWRSRSKALPSGRPLRSSGMYRTTRRATRQEEASKGARSIAAKRTSPRTIAYRISEMGRRGWRWIEHGRLELHADRDLALRRAAQSPQQQERERPASHAEGAQQEQGIRVTTRPPTNSTDIGNAVMRGQQGRMVGASDAPGCGELKASEVPCSVRGRNRLESALPRDHRSSR